MLILHCPASGDVTYMVEVARAKNNGDKPVLS